MVKQQFQSTVGWRTYLDPTNNNRVTRFLKTNGNSVFNQIVKNIHMAISNDYKQLVLIVHPNVPSVVVVTASEYPELLEHCLNWFKTHEDYEQCSNIIKIKSKIKRTPSAIILN